MRREVARKDNSPPTAASNPIYIKLDSRSSCKLRPKYRSKGSTQRPYSLATLRNLLMEGKSQVVGLMLASFLSLTTERIVSLPDRKSVV